jgi:tRNA/tmRNA/rRNA uracil-C5-methylase (TrmA/RlmC/RlmD family)
VESVGGSAARPADAGRADGLLDLVVGEVAHGGWCVAREPGDLPGSGGRVVFVRHALPGERVLARVTEATARFARADAVKILEVSPDRVEPRCPQARPGGCGGCDWQHASLDAQRRLKAAVISQQLRRIAGIEREVMVEGLPGDDEGLRWRTRVRFAMRPDGIAGLRKHRSHEVVDVGDCPIAHPLVAQAGATGRRWEGARSVEVVVSPGSGERALIVSPATGHRPAGRTAGRPAGSSAHPAAGRQPAPPNEPGADSVPSGRSRSGFGHVVSGREPGHRPAGERQEGPGKRYTSSWAERDADSVLIAGSGGRLTPLRGQGSLRQTAAGRTWRVSAGAFWQVHPGAADALAGAVLDALQPEPGNVALDLFCGAGLFAGVLADAVGPAGAVAAVESDPAAVRDAKHNLRGTPWARVYRGDAAEVLARGGWPEAGLAVLDPPRTGASRPVIERLLARPAAGAAAGGLRRVAYVSCDPATLARDLAVFAESGWRLAALRAFDAFPMTHHVECVATLLPE